MTVSDLLEQPCNKSDNINKVVTSLFHTCWQLGTSSENTTCWRLVGRVATRCAIFTRVHYGSTCTSAENNVLNFTRTCLDIIFLWYWFLLYTGWIRNLWWFARTIWVLRSSKLNWAQWFALFLWCLPCLSKFNFFPASVKYVWPGCDIFSYWISGDCICFVFGQMFWSSARCHRYTTTTPQCAEIKAHFHSGKFSAERKMCKCDWQTQIFHF